MNLPFDAVPFDATETGRVRMDPAPSHPCGVCGWPCEPDTARTRVRFDSGHEIVVHDDPDMYSCMDHIENHERLKEFFHPKPTGRGFAGVTFKDRYGENCSIQQSSLATDAAIWFGTEGKAVYVQGPHMHQVFTPPPEVMVKSRMHLTRDQVRRLLPVLQHWVDTGELDTNTTSEDT